MVRALQTWPYYGVPKNPAAWLDAGGEESRLDTIRREKLSREAAADHRHIEQWPGEAEGGSPRRRSTMAATMLARSLLISREDQVALALNRSADIRHTGGITCMAGAGKQKIWRSGHPPEIPEGDELARRFDAVLQSLISCSTRAAKPRGEALIREDLSPGSHPPDATAGRTSRRQSTEDPRVAVDAAGNAARIPARTDSDGNLLRLQSRITYQRWHQSMIAQGGCSSGALGGRRELSEYHLFMGHRGVSLRGARLRRDGLGHIPAHDRLSLSSTIHPSRRVEPRGGRGGSQRPTGVD